MQNELEGYRNKLSDKLQKNTFTLLEKNFSMQQDKKWTHKKVSP